MMQYQGEDLRLLDGGLGHEEEINCFDDSPTWIVDHAWDRVQQICRRALAAYMQYCREEGLPHSYLLGLDVLIMGEIDPDNPHRIIDIRPTMVEGPCCNSYPACPNIDSYKLFRRLQAKGVDPDRIEYPTHPTEIRRKIAQVFIDLWRGRGKSGRPRVGIFTRPYAESEEESAHRLILEGFLAAGLDAYRITPEEKPVVKDGYIWVKDVPVDFCYRRIERIHVPLFYGDRLGREIIEDTPNTQWINPWKIDDLRSKTIEETVFRRWEAGSGETISRPITLLGSEITPEAVSDLALRGGYVMKRWNSTGGKGVFLHINMAHAKAACDFLYRRYDGRHMMLLDRETLGRELENFRNFSEDAAIQQCRFVDARILGEKRRLVYDTRINVLYNPARREWEFLSGFSRSVPCGDGVTNGNSLLTNISAGAEISPLIIGQVQDETVREQIEFGPLLAAMMDGKDSISF